MTAARYWDILLPSVVFLGVFFFVFRFMGIGRLSQDDGLTATISMRKAIAAVFYGCCAGLAAGVLVDLAGEILEPDGSRSGGIFVGPLVVAAVAWTLIGRWRAVEPTETTTTPPAPEPPRTRRVPAVSAGYNTATHHYRLMARNAANDARKP